MLAYFIRLWALDHGHKLLSTLATVYMFVLLLPVIIVFLVLIFVGIFLLFMAKPSGHQNIGGWPPKYQWRPFWLKNKTWTR